jgi:hypothetical protein
VKLVVRPIYRSTNKHRFIVTHIDHLLNSGRFHASQDAIDNSDLIGEMDDYSATSKGHDDCLDAVAGAISQLGMDTLNFRGKGKIVSGFGHGLQKRKKRGNPLDRKKVWKK